MKESKDIQRKRKPFAVTKRERARNRKIARLLLAFVLLAVAFALGFAVRSQTAFVASLGFPVTEGQGQVSSTAQAKSSYDSVSARVSDVEDLLADNSLDSIDLGEATDSMLEAMMESTGDPYAAYFDPERYNSYIKETTGRPYGGIGVLFAEYNGRAYVADVFEGSEAEAKGVQQGDFVESIDGDGSRTWTLTETVNALAREDGQNAVVTWMRPISLDAQTGTELTTTLTVKAYDEINVTTEMVNDVGYIKLRQITQNASDLVSRAVTDLSNQGARAFVLDLRDNPGGYLTQSVAIASLFLQSGVAVEIETVDGISSKTVSGTRLTDAPLVLIANGYTAAAAEVLTAALQDNQRSQVVGSTTLGKGSVQVVRELSFGGAIRYTAAYYLTPLGHAINGVGITPNVSISNTGDMDTQMLVALDTAQSLVRA